MMLADNGRVQEGISSLRSLLTSHGHDAELHHAIGLLQFRIGALEQAAFHFDKARHLDPKRADMHANYATSLNLMGRSEDAIEPYEKAVSLEPRHFGAQLGLSSALFGANQYEQAAAAAKVAADISPNRPEPWVNLALALTRSGRSDEAISSLRQAIANISDQPLLLTNLVQALNHRHDADPQEVFQRHLDLGRALTAMLGGGIRSFNYDPSPDRPLRIGYLSTGFREHAVGHFMASVLSAHDRSKFQTFVYSSTGRADSMTDRLRSFAGTWVDVSRMPDAAVVQQVGADRIDVLVELDGHNPGSRIGVLALRAAPVQVSWMNYPNTTGLKAVGYRIVDGVTDPDGAEALSAEKLVRMPGCFLCYQPSVAAPGVSGAPCIENKHVTFGSFNAAPKIVEPVVEAWSALLRGLPGSRLVLKSEVYSEEAATARLRDRFTGLGISADRLEFHPRTESAADHLALYSRIDIALDTFPYNGTATTCEALDMGVPVVTLRGKTHAGRVGASILTAAGLQSMIAESTGDYTRIATELARDPAKLASLRTGLRARVRNSPLCDGAAFTRALEAQYREMWRAWGSNLLMY